MAYIATWLSKPYCAAEYGLPQLGSSHNAPTRAGTIEVAQRPAAKFLSEDELWRRIMGNRIIENGCFTQLI